MKSNKIETKIVAIKGVLDARIAIKIKIKNNEKLPKIFLFNEISEKWLINKLSININDKPKYIEAYVGWKSEKFSKEDLKWWWKLWALNKSFKVGYQSGFPIFWIRVRKAIIDEIRIKKIEDTANDILIIFNCLWLNVIGLK